MKHFTEKTKRNENAPFCVQGATALPNLTLWPASLSHRHYFNDSNSVKTASWFTASIPSRNYYETICPSKALC